MKLLEQLLAHGLREEVPCIIFPNLNLNASELVTLECYKALDRIKIILEDDTLCDADCYEKIEAIVQVYDNLGSGCGTRHDWG